tara:strand:+ start:502 stop:1137 length:636 start_codon:yes stop_codon:yes gene_type:complete
MNKDLLSNNYLIVKNFISKKEAEELGSSFIKKDFLDKDGDDQVPNCKAVYNPHYGVYLLNEKCDEISRIIGSKVIPTYSYARVYEKGHYLPIHKDRPACEISLTVHLKSDTKWPIWVVTPEGLPMDIELESGDAMIYLGCMSHHWRTKYMGDNYAQVFLHYVRKDGIYRSEVEIEKGDRDDKGQDDFYGLLEDYKKYLPSFTSYIHDNFGA